ncbi:MULTISPECIES: ribbon-helix-helix protein, CopG family [unclassified Sphingomonas]|uniref:ribbon-helix-helix protein, CopG family n=1 Tax=unclassified Sphingomonas TaxID=196159 RepID=UPI0006F440A1|nr:MULTISPECIES: ribbon-helix-helix protein, CopG family [unclassified Sphingomonas]KQX24265.1 hypothetical protein ASD17_25370 [Sphingomonas sp. Root1294]KQY69562.1 hypothetical protein ASD39_24665 [Sphingomonas sp. Root50]KRB87490.1 hypothetical protein ASE22_24215 [Sphingomonas sp. Root720]
MTMFNVRLSGDVERDLVAQARALGLSKSEIAREAITQFLDRKRKNETDLTDIHDDWSDFGAEVVAAHKSVLLGLMSKLDDADWEAMVEPLYRIFRAKVLEKTKAYSAPFLSTVQSDEPYLCAAIGFAADDCEEIKIPLSKLFYDFAWFAGLEDFNRIPAIWESVKQRLSAEDSQA